MQANVLVPDDVVTLDQRTRLLALPLAFLHVCPQFGEHCPSGEPLFERRE
jgi:hypothetical protein